jgi:nicotinamide-nucleotide amidase
MQNIAHIVTIGDEILIGQIMDTNSAFIATELTSLGFKVDQIVSISDQRGAILSQLSQSMQTANLVVITGGLGPTNDDITKKTLCELFNTPLTESADVLADVESFLSRRGVKMNPLNQQQALVPQNARILRNKQGTAPGMWFNFNNGALISLPGVPFEMKALMLAQVLPALKAHFHLPVIYYKTLKTTGIAESHLAELLAEWEAKLPQGVSLAYLPSPGLVKLRLGATGKTKSEVKAIIDPLAETLKQLVGNKYLGQGSDTLESVIGTMLMARQQTMVTAESCTGGAVAASITQIPGCSAWFRGAVVAYSNDVKIKQLGVKASAIEKFGAVSEQVVNTMAINAAKKLKAHFAIAISGIAGPDGGTPDKPVGTVWIAVAHPKGCEAKLFRFGTERDINIKRTTMAALNMLRLILLDAE